MTPLDRSGGSRAAEHRRSIGYDDQNLYLALKVFDRHIVRTGAAGRGEDHATLFIAFPRGRGFVTYPVQVFPGNPGKVAGRRQAPRAPR